jgi:hypothetical protein
MSCFPGSFPRFAWLCFLVFSALATLAIPAQTLNTNPPGGSYTSNCKNISVNTSSHYPFKWKLIATCKKNNGTWDPTPTTLIGYYSCYWANNDIKNVNGQLECALPSGPYLSDCPANGDRMTADGGATPGGNVLVAKCFVGNGVVEELKFGTADQCLSPGILILDDPNQPRKHQLVCPFPPGSYLQSCTSVRVRDPLNLYNGASVLWATCTTRDGQQSRTQLFEPYVACTSFSGDIANIDGVLTCNIGGHCHGAGFYGTCIVTSGSVPPEAGSTTGCPGNPYNSCP